MAEKETPRRRRIEPNIYERRDGKLEVGYRDSTGRQRWQRVQHPGLKAARAERDTILGRRGRGERVVPSPRLRFGEAAERWLAEEVSEKRPATARVYGSHYREHLAPRWARRRMDRTTVTEVLQLMREMRAAGKSEWTIAGVRNAARCCFEFAGQNMGYVGKNPVRDLRRGQRAKTSSTQRRRIYHGQELEQTLAAAGEPWRTLFALAAVTGARLSELLALRWQDFDLADPENASVAITAQVDRQGRREPLKTDSSQRVIELPRQLVAMLLEHKARSPRKAEAAFVFATRHGRPLGQRNAGRALRLAQTKARTPDGRPTFPMLFEAEPDARGRWVEKRRRKGESAVPRGAVPCFHGFRHNAASRAIAEGESAEEVSWQLGHKDSTVTRAVYTHEIASAERRARRRSRMEAQYGAMLEAQMEATARDRAQQTDRVLEAEVVDLRDVRDRAQQA